MKNVFINIGSAMEPQWELREHFDVDTMIAYNYHCGREEDHINVVMELDLKFELPKGTEYFQTYSSEPRCVE